MERLKFKVTFTNAEAAERCFDGLGKEWEEAKIELTGQDELTVTAIESFEALNKRSKRLIKMRNKKV